MENITESVIPLPEMGSRQRLQDPFKMCRLCFQTPGEHDVSKSPLYLQAIQNLYKIIVSVPPQFSSIYEYTHTH